MGETNESNDHRLAKPILFGWLLVIAFVGVCAFLIDYRHHLRAFQIAWGVGCVGYGLIIFALIRHPSHRLGSWPIWFLGIVAIRIALLHTVPSDDLHRYVWEGKIQRYGLNPYVTVPENIDHVELTQNDSNWSRINHRDFPAIYPPLSQLLFRLTSMIGDSVYIVKGAIVFIELLAILVLGRLLIALDRSPHWAAVFALCPLTITTIAIDGHQDSLMILALATASLAATRKLFWMCGAFLGAAISTKTVALILLPWLFFQRPLALVATVAVAVICYLPFADAGIHVFDSLLRFGNSETSLGLLVTMIEPVLGGDQARMFAAFVVAAFAMALATKRLELPQYAARVFAMLIFALPVVQAWYLNWFLAFAWSRVRIAWLILCMLAIFYFEAEASLALTGEWKMPSWVFAAWYAPFALAWVVEFIWIKRSRRRGED